MIRKERNDYSIRSVCLALTLLEQFRGEIHELRVHELSRLLHINRHRALKLLFTLNEHNYLEKILTTDSYHLGLKALKLSESYIKSRPLVQEARRSLESLSQQSRETAFLAVFGSGRLVCRDAVESPLPVKVVPKIGVYLPLQCTAAGKVILACGSEDNLDISTNTWRKEQESIREAGYAISIGTFEPGANAVAAAIRNHLSQVVGVICVAGPSFRLDDERIKDEVAPLVVRAAKDISVQMGYKEQHEHENSLYNVNSQASPKATCSTNESLRSGSAALGDTFSLPSIAGLSGLNLFNPTVSVERDSARRRAGIER